MRGGARIKIRDNSHYSMRCQEPARTGSGSMAVPRRDSVDGSCCGWSAGGSSLCVGVGKDVWEVVSLGVMGPDMSFRMTAVWKKGGS